MAYTHVTSPLRHIDRFPPIFPGQHSLRRRQKDGDSFVNDAVKTWYSHRARRSPIIPRYNAIQDYQARAYFLAPSVQDVLKTTVDMQEISRSNSSESLNKMSGRKVVPKTPSREFRGDRETTYINDAVLTNNKRTKYKDIIPRYDAASDWHSRLYFSRDDVRGLLEVTRGSKSREISRPKHGRFALKTPTVEETKRREDAFINDAILTERKKWRYWDIIPPYQGDADPHSKKYFERLREVEEMQRSLKEQETERKERE